MFWHVLSQGIGFPISSYHVPINLMVNFPGWLVTPSCRGLNTISAYIYIHMPHCIPTHLNTFSWFSHLSFMATSIIFCGFICMGQMPKNPHLRSLLVKSLVCPHDEAIVYGHQPDFSHIYIYIYIYRIFFTYINIYIYIYICIVHIRIYI